MSTQQGWFFRVGVGGDGDSVLTFFDLEGMDEVPDFVPFKESIRSENTIDIARTQRTKMYKFNKLVDGLEMSVKCYYRPEQPAQAKLIEFKGNNEGVWLQWGHIDVDGVGRAWQFRALVVDAPIKGAGSESVDAVDAITFELKTISDPFSISIADEG